MHCRRLLIVETGKPVLQLAPGGLLEAGAYYFNLPLRGGLIGGGWDEFEGGLIGGFTVFEHHTLSRGNTVFTVCTSINIPRVNYLSLTPFKRDYSRGN